MSQHLNTSFNNYYKPQVKDINNIYRLESNQGQVQALIPTNNQDLLGNLWAICNKIMSIYQKICSTFFINTNLALINNHLIPVTLPTIPIIFPTDLNYYIIEIKDLKLQLPAKYNRNIENINYKR